MSSVFLERPEEWTMTNDHAILLPSYFEASPGHSLVVPKREVPTVFNLSDEEMASMWELVRRGVAVLELEHKPDGFNIGVNCGEAAGQTVMHAHIHIIPRFKGDMEDPRGGVRLCIPEKGNYLAKPDALGEDQ